MSSQFLGNVVLNLTYFKPKLGHCSKYQATLLVELADVAFFAQKCLDVASNLMRRCSEVTLISKIGFFTNMQCGFKLMSLYY